MRGDILDCSNDHVALLFPRICRPSSGNEGPRGRVMKRTKFLKLAKVEDEQLHRDFRRGGSNASTMISKRQIRAEDVVFREMWCALRVKGICPCNAVGLPRIG